MNLLDFETTKGISTHHQLLNEFKQLKLTRRRQSINPRSNHGMLFPLIILPILITQLLFLPRIKARKAAYAQFHQIDPNSDQRAQSSKSSKIVVGIWGSTSSRAPA